MKTLAPRLPRYVRSHFTLGWTRRDRKVRARARRILLRRYPARQLPVGLRRKGDR